MQASLRIVRDTDTTTAAPAPAVKADDSALRPLTFADYTGQRAVIANLRTAVTAARAGRWSLDHVLLSGPPGLGKTSLAQVIANEMGGKLVLASAPSISHKGELAALLTSLKAGDLLFIDEFHRLDIKLQELLYTAIEDFRIDLFTGGKGSKGGKAISVPLPKFTLIASTTHAGMLTGPMRDRFGIQCQLSFYTADELASIVSRSAAMLGVDLDPAGAAEIAHRSRSTPRIANRLLRRVRDFAAARAYERAIVPAGYEHGPAIVHVTEDDAIAALDAQGIDSAGLDATDRAYLEALVSAPGPVGIEALSAALSAPRATLEDVTEPFLLQLGFIKRTGRGRTATEAGTAHLTGAL